MTKELKIDFMIEKRINLFWWARTNNLGDNLSPYLVERLSGQKIAPLPFKYTKDTILHIIRQLWNFKRLYKQDLMGELVPESPCMTAIGSILGECPADAVVWGSGFLEASHMYRGNPITACRGALTRDVLIKQGAHLPAQLPLGDPAILTPLVHNRSVEKKYTVGLIPHISELDYFTKHYGAHRIIRFDTDRVWDTIDELRSCAYILSSSLHGIILAHAYGIPAIWVNTGILSSSAFKFHDYFSSVQIPFYYGFFDLKEVLSSEADVMRFFNQHAALSLPHIDLAEAQQALLRVSPFEVLPEYLTK